MEMKIYALLAGINNYTNIPKLKGCVHDVEKIEKYLKQYAANCEIEKLVDDEATKSAIVSSFNNIKQKIRASDSFLFYYSGHGTQEAAGDIWRETDERLECIVCYDDFHYSAHNYLLADKELRYLVAELSKTKCHIVTIFDCCHSGDNTRSSDRLAATFNKRGAIQKRYARRFPERAWKDFIFGEAIDRNDITGKSVNEFLPQGIHVQIAACESDETALEENEEGVFTRALIKVLEDTRGDVSYYDLRSRVRQYLRFEYRQQPRIYTIGYSDEETQALLFTRFLNHQQIIDKHFVTESVYNIKRGWLLNLGAIHGIKMDTVVDLADPNIPGKLYRFLVKTIFIDHSVLEPGKDTTPPVGRTIFKALSQGLGLKQIKLHVKSYIDNAAKLKGLADVLISNAGGHFSLTEQEELADYSLQVRPDMIYLTLPGDPFRPLIQPVEIYGYRSQGTDTSYVNVRQLSEYLKHVSRWNYTKNLQCIGFRSFYEEPVKVDIVQVFDNKEEKIIAINKTAPWTGSADLFGAVKSRMRISITNQTEQKLHVAIACLTYDFKVLSNLLPRKVELLIPGKPVFLKNRSDGTNDNLINLNLPDVVEEYNWPAYTETIKIIVSSKEFDVEMLTLDALPSANTLKGLFKTKEKTRGFAFKPDDEPVSLQGWVTQTVHLTYPNIFYNIVDPARISKMLASEKMAFFAEGLYKKSL